MKKLFYLIYLLSWAYSGFAQDAFEKGNEQYRNGQFAEAAASYEAILREDLESAELYFNLGNAYYKLDSVALSIYNYEKALRLDPGNKDAKINLVLANTKVIGDITEVPEGGLSKFLAGLTGMYHYDTWAWIAIGASVASLLLFCGFYFGNTNVMKRAFFAAMGASLLLVIVAIAAAFYAKGKAETARPAIVFANMAVVRAEPSATAQDGLIVHEGTKVYVDEEKGSWKKITLADDTAGWIESNAIRELR